MVDLALYAFPLLMAFYDPTLLLLNTIDIAAFGLPTLSRIQEGD